MFGAFVMFMSLAMYAFGYFTGRASKKDENRKKENEK